MNSMRKRLMILLAFILLICQLISVVWLWHESREQIAYLVNETLSATLRNQYVNGEIHEAFASLLVPSLVMIGFTLFFSFWAITWITRPLGKLSHNLATRSADNLSPLPTLSGTGEVMAVTRALNQLFARLDHTIQQERLFTADAAHELRTPLAGLRLHLELMAQSGVTQAPMLISRIDQLMHTIEQLLMLARAGQALASGHYKTLVWTSDILAPLKGELEEMMVSHQQTIIWPENSPITVQGDAVLLRLMVRNLMENAWRYSPKNSTIKIILISQNKGVMLTIIDQGPGINEEYRQQLTEPFHRMDRRYGGSGLGLNIVLRILQLHHGQLSLENGRDGGLNVCCWLPETIQ